MEQEIVGLVFTNLRTLSCAVVASFLICCAYWFAVSPGQRAVWLPLVLVLLTVTTALVISVIKGSIALSLGLIGALSVARFRTRINDPRQLALVLVAIALGIGFGANELLLTSIGAVFIAGLIVIFYKPSLSALSTPQVSKVVAQLNFTGDDPVSIEALSEFLRGQQVAFAIRNMSRTAGTTAITVHLQDCTLAWADQLTRDLADVFPAHQCDCQLQLKAQGDADTEKGQAFDVPENTHKGGTGVDVPSAFSGNLPGKGSRRTT